MKTMKKTLGSLTAKIAALLLAFTCAGSAWGAAANVAYIGDTKYESLAAALADVGENAPLTWVDDSAWPSATPVYYNGNFYATLTAAITAANTANASTAALIYVRPNYSAGGKPFVADHDNIKTSITIYGNNASIGFNWEPCVEHSDSATYHTMTKDVAFSIYNLHDGAGVWGIRTSNYKSTVIMANCNNAHEYMVNGNAGSANSVCDVTIRNCTFGTRNNVVVASTNPGTVVIDGCTFTENNNNYVVNINNKNGGTTTATISNSTFNGGGNGSKGVVRINGEVENTTMSGAFANLTFNDTSSAIADIQIGHATEAADNKVNVSYTVSGTTGVLKVFETGSTTLKNDGETSIVAANNYTGDNTPPHYVAQVEIAGTTTKYADLHAALEAGKAAGSVVTLLADVDLAGVAWEPVGTSADPFCGSFDGNGKTVSNLEISAPSGYGVGLIGNAKGNNTIKNLHLHNVSINGDETVALAGVKDVAGVVGHLDANAYMFENITLDGLIKIRGNKNVGGVVGERYFSAKDCTVAGDEGSFVKSVYFDDDIDGDNAGGFGSYHGGEGTASLRNISISGLTITGTRKVGGVLGCTGASVSITDVKVSNITVGTTATAEYATSKKASMGVGGLVGNIVFDNKSGSHPGGTYSGTVQDVTIAELPSGVTGTGDGKNVSYGLLVGGNHSGMTDPASLLTSYAGLIAKGYDAAKYSNDYLINNYVATVTDAEGNFVGGYSTVDDALIAVKTLAGATVNIFAGDYTLTTTSYTFADNVTVVGETDAEGNNLVTINNTELTFVAMDFTLKDVNIVAQSGSALHYAKTTGLFEHVNITSPVNGIRECKIFDDGTMTFKDCTIVAGTYGIHYDTGKRTTINIIGGSISGWNSFGSVVEHVNISGTEFPLGANYNQLRFYQDAVMSNVTFNGSMNLDFGQDGESMILSDCVMADGSDVKSHIRTSDLANENRYVAVGSGVTLDENGKIVGGVFETIDAALIADSYISIDNLDSETSANYPLTVDGPYEAIVLDENGALKQGYATLAEAIAAAQSGDTVTLLADTAVADTITINKSMTLDLNGKTITNTSTGKRPFYVVTEDTSSVVETADEDGNVVFEGATTLTVEGNGGSLVIPDGGTAYGFFDIAKPYTGIVINGGTISGDGGNGSLIRYGVDGGYAQQIALNNVTGITKSRIVSYATAYYLWDIKVIGGTYTHNNYRNDNGGYLKNAFQFFTQNGIFDGVTITSDEGSCVCCGGSYQKNMVFRNNTFTVKEKSIISDPWNNAAIAVQTAGSLTIESGTYTSAGIYGVATANSGATINIEGGTITGADYGVRIYGGGYDPDTTLNISGTASVTGGQAGVYVLEIGNGNGTATAKINGGTIAGGITIDNKTATPSRATVEIEDGEVSGTLTDASPSGKSGVYSVSGGVFSSQVSAEYCTADYSPITNTDPKTSAAYPYTVASDYEAQIVRNGEVVSPKGTLAAMVAAAQPDDTIQLLRDVAGAGALALPANATLESYPSPFTLSGNTTVTLAPEGGAVKNIAFANIKKAAGTIDKVISLAGTPADNAAFTITGNTFTGLGETAYVIIDAAEKAVAVTLEGNVFNTPSGTKTKRAFAVANAAEGSTLNLSGNYIASGLLFGASTVAANVSDTAAYPQLETADATSATKALPAFYIKRLAGDNLPAIFGYDALDAAVEDAKEGDTIYIEKADATLAVAATTVAANVTLDGKGKTLSLSADGKLAGGKKTEYPAADYMLTLQNVTVAFPAGENTAARLGGNVTLGENVTIDASAVTALGAPLASGVTVAEGTTPAPALTVGAAVQAGDTLITSLTLGEGASIAVSGLPTGLYNAFADNTLALRTQEAKVTVGETVTYYNTLQEALNAAVTATSEPLVEALVDEIDATGWTSCVFNSASKLITFDGHDVTIKNLDAPLVNKSGSGAKGIVVKNVTVKDADIQTTDNYAAVFLPYADCVGTIYFENCHIADSTVTGNKHVGGFVGYNSGYNVLSDGPVFNNVTIKDCSVMRSTFTSNEGSVGALMGHAAGNQWSSVAISETAVSNNTMTCNESIKAGALIGTVGQAGFENNGKTGGVTVSAYVGGNTAVANGVSTDQIFGRIGSPNGKIEVTGGTYDGTATYANNSYDHADNKMIVISGGTFQTQPSQDAIADGFVAELSQDVNGWWTVGGPFVAKIGNVGYATLAEAANAAVANDTIEIIASTDEMLPRTKVANVTYTASEGVVLSGGVDTNWWQYDVTLDGLAFTGKGASISADNTAKPSVTVKNCTFTDCAATAKKEGALSIKGSPTKVTVEGCTITDVQENPAVDEANRPVTLGMYIIGGEVSVVGNTVSGVGQSAIYVQTDKAMTITDNVISNWGSCGKGRAIRLDMKDNATEPVVVARNVMSDPDSATKEAFVQIARMSEAGNVNVAENYWGGAGPFSTTADGTLLFSADNEVASSTMLAAAPTWYVSYSATEGLDDLRGLVAYVVTSSGALRGGFVSLASAIAAAQEGDTVEILAAEISEGSITFPATLKNVTIKAADGVAATLKNTTLNSATGSAVDYEGITIDGLVFDNSRILFTGSRTGEVVYKDWAIVNCTFKNIVASGNLAAVQFGTFTVNKESMNGFTFTNNVIDGVSGSSNSGLNVNRLSGETLIEANIIKNVAWNAFQLLNGAEGSTVTITNNYFASAGDGVVNLSGNNADITFVENAVVNTGSGKGVEWIVDGVDVTGNYWGGGEPSVAHGKPVSYSYYTTYAETTDWFTLSNPVGAVAVVKAGDTLKGGYYTVADAIANVDDGQTILLQRDSNVVTGYGKQIGDSGYGEGAGENRLVIDNGKTFTFDLGGNTLSGRINFTHGNMTLTNGTVKASVQALNIYGTKDYAYAGQNYSVITIGADVTVEAGYGLCVFGGDPNSGYYPLGFGEVFNVYGKVHANSPVYVSGNVGMDEYEKNTGKLADVDALKETTGKKVSELMALYGPTINIYEGAELIATPSSSVSDNSQGISLSGCAIVNVTGGTITGAEGVGMKGGVLNVTGGKITGTGAKCDPVQAVSSGTESSGAAISASTFYNAYYPIVINVTGGTIESANNAALLVAHSVRNGTPINAVNGVTATISGGTFIGGANEEAVIIEDAREGEEGLYPENFVSGGLFTTPVPEEYCAVNYVPAVYDETQGLYTVKTGHYVAEVAYEDGEGNEVVEKFEMDEDTTEAEALAAAAARADELLAGDTDSTITVVVPTTGLALPAGWTFVTDESVTTLQRAVAQIVTINGDGTVTTNMPQYATLEAAVAAAASEATIELVRDVTLADGGLLLDKSLTLFGATDAEGKPLRTITGQPTLTLDDGAAVIVTEADADAPMAVTLKDLNLTGFGEAAVAFDAYNAGSSLTLTNLGFTAFGQSAVASFGDGELTVQECSIDGDGVTDAIGLYVENTTTSVTGGTIRNVGAGLAAAGAEVTLDNVSVTANANGAAILAEDGAVVSVVGADSAYAGALEADSYSDIAATAGTFDRDIYADGYCADGYITVPAETAGWFKVESGAYVATVTHEGTTTPYPSFAAAADVAEADDVVTLLDDCDASDAYTLAVGGTLKVEKGAFACVVKAPADYVLKESEADANGVTTYSSVAAIARIDWTSSSTYGTFYYSDYFETVDDAFAECVKSKWVEWEGSEKRMYPFVVLYEDVASAMIPASRINDAPIKVMRNGKEIGEVGFDGMRIVRRSDYNANYYQYYLDEPYVQNRETGKYYNGLENAVAEVEDGETLVVVKAISASNAFTVDNGKTFAIDLSGKAIGGFRLRSGFVTVSNGTMGGTVSVYGSSDSSLAAGEYSKLVIGGDVVMNNEDSIIFFPHGYNTAAQVEAAYGTQIDVYGRTASISVNGVIHAGNSVVNIREGAVVDGGSDHGLYIAGHVTVNVEDGAAVTGVTGIEMRAGVLNVTGGTITETASGLTVTPNAGGSTVVGAAVAISQHVTELPVTVNISGGTLNANAGGVALFETDTVATGTPSQDVAALVAGGMFYGAVTNDNDVITIPALVGEDANPARFSEEFKTQGVPADYKLVAVDGTDPVMYMVAAKDYKVLVISDNGATTNKCETLAEAFAAADAGDTVKLLADVVMGEHAYANKAVGIDGDGHSITFVKDDLAAHDFNYFPIWIEGAAGAPAITFGNVTFNGNGGNYTFGIEQSASTLDGVTINANGNEGLCVQAGSATLENVVIRNTGTNATDWHNSALTLAQNAEVVVNGGEYTSENGYALYLLTTGGRFTINGGTFAGKIRAGVNDSSITSEILIKGGKFNVPEFKTDGATAKITISGGVFTAAPNAAFLAENYIVVDNEDAATKADYPYTVVETLVGDSFTYPIEGTSGVAVTKEWLAANVSDVYGSDKTAPILAGITNALVEALGEPGENGIPKWQSYVLGQNPSNADAKLRLTAEPAAGDTVKVTGVIDLTEKPDIQGVTVTFRLAARDVAGTEWTDLQSGKADPAGFDPVSLDAVAGKVLAVFADIVTE